jgi:hypothetical protein
MFHDVFGKLRVSLLTHHSSRLHFFDGPSELVYFPGVLPQLRYGIRVFAASNCVEFN